MFKFNSSYLCSLSIKIFFQFLLISFISTVFAGNKKRKIPGEIIAHQAVETNQFIGSPGLCVLPNGSLLVTHDLFGKGSTEFISAQTNVYLSDNKGKNWHQIAMIDGQFWSKPFYYNDKLYLIGTDKHHGNLIIRESVDSGHTWSNPVNSQSGLISKGEFHCAPTPVIEHQGYLWKAMERADGEIKRWGKRYSTFMLSIKVGDNPLDAKNWRMTNHLPYDSTYLKGKFGAWLEGNAVVGKNGAIYNILRVHTPADIYEEHAAIVEIADNGATSVFDEVNGFIKFPGGSKKFSVKYDTNSKKYLAIVNYVPKEFRGEIQLDRVRNTQALISSTDLKNWTVHKILLHHPDRIRHGFNYIDWEIVGNDIIYLSRTAYDTESEQAQNYHDANFLTFHRLKTYRKSLRKNIEEFNNYNTSDKR
ncbi:sialidase family protein [Pseudopedobacter beijingensis]|uniref:Sialidase family protein n=1 Tax=Pseudopedobacter beijingensis TaxID=1207056 RepID=A0ABW4I8B3_9SPHI